MLATIENVDDGDQKEYIKKLINIFCCCHRSTSRNWWIYFVFVMWYIIYFFKGNRMRKVFGTSGTCWPPWRTSTTATRRSTSRSDEVHHGGPHVHHLNGRLIHLGKLGHLVNLNNNNNHFNIHIYTSTSTKTTTTTKYLSTSWCTPSGRRRRRRRRPPSMSNIILINFLMYSI